MKCLSGLNDWKIFEKNHQTTALDVKNYILKKTIH